MRTALWFGMSCHPTQPHPVISSTIRAVSLHGTETGKRFRNVLFLFHFLAFSLAKWIVVHSSGKLYCTFLLLLLVIHSNWSIFSIRIVLDTCQSQWKEICEDILHNSPLFYSCLQPVESNSTTQFLLTHKI